MITRRTALAAGAAGAGAVALAACGSSSSKSQSQSTPTANAQLVKLDDIEVGRCVSAQLPDGRTAIVSRPTSDTAVAFSAKCTHMGCTVQPAGTELHCPCHGSKYNALTGAVIHGPAPRPLAKLAVRVANGEVVTS
jgi:cytochrome b6-f complex iron-sulfur subunit